MRQPIRPAVLAALLAGAVAACDLGQGPGPTAVIDPSASPIIEARPEVCLAIDGLERELADLRAVRLRPANRDMLDLQYDELSAAWDEVRRLAPEGMEDQLELVRRALVDLWLAVEDFTTSFDPEKAVDHVQREAAAFAKAFTRLRDRTDCPPWVRPTPGPETPSPSGSGAPAPAGPPASGPPGASTVAGAPAPSAARSVERGEQLHVV
jgi:hypothetical protein